MVITICIGSSCHLKGSREVIQIFERQVGIYHLEDKIEMQGSFCMGQCVHGVGVKIDEEQYSVTPAEAEEFFRSTVMPKLSQ